MSQKNAPQIRFVDRPDLTETFSDSVHGLSFDGQTMRIEFCSVRIDPPKSPETRTGRQYPVCRMVLTPNAALDLYGRLQQVIQALEKKGAIQRTPPTSTTMQ
jgi:hypothetical protein